MALLRLLALHMGLSKAAPEIAESEKSHSVRPLSGFGAQVYRLYAESLLLPNR